jgi:hypothetical protein
MPRFMSANLPEADHVIARAGRSVRFHDERLVDGSVREAVADVNRYFSRQRLEKAATQDARGRRARRQHDGGVQAMSPGAPGS